MARSTRGDSSKDTSSRQTSRGTSSDTKNARNAGASAAQTNRGAQSRGAADLSGTTSRATQTAQSSTTTAQSNRAGQSKPEDRERVIETRDDGRGTEGRTAVGGVSPRQGSAPIFGGSGVGGNPFAAMRRWSEDMDRLFQDFGFGQFGLGVSPRREIGELGRRLGLSDRVEWAPQVEAFRRGDNIVVRADLPGLKKEDVKVEVEDNMLTISGERNAEHEENRQGFYRSERSYGQFYRSIPLPEGVNADQCEATFKDGVLEVSLRAPQPRDKSAKQIPVR